MKNIKSIEEEYTNYCENYSEGSKVITDSYQNLHDAFDEFLNAIQEHEWKAGFNYAMRLMTGGNDTK